MAFTEIYEILWKAYRSYCDYSALSLKVKVTLNISLVVSGLFQAATTDCICQIVAPTEAHQLRPVPHKHPINSGFSEEKVTPQALRFANTAGFHDAGKLTAHICS